MIKTILFAWLLLGLANVIEASPLPRQTCLLLTSSDSLCHL